MIAYLKGKIVQKSEDRLILDVRDVGYGVEISNQTFQTLPEKGKELEILIYHHFTDNDQRLFGFTSQKEKNLFERLITVKGIGPKLGLTILSGMSAPELIQAIVTQNTSALSGISGIGKKTAERMVLELKDKLFVEGEPSLVSPGGEQLDKRSEAVSALEALGFKKRDAEKTVQSTVSADGSLTVSEIVKKALTEMNR